MLFFADASPSPSGSPIPSPNPSVVSTLSNGDATAMLVVIGVVVVLTGLIVLLGRWVLTPKDAPPDEAPSLIRSWIAISLVSGLLFFCAASFLVSDSTLRSTLFGGLIGAVGTAVAFYFSSNAAAQARRDVLNAALGTVEVPDLVGIPAGSKTLGQAQEAMSQKSLQLQFSPSSATPAYKVTTQSPAAGTKVRSGSTVTVTTEAPVQE
jgi:hypothetical protein